MVETARIVTAALQIDSPYSQVGVSVHLNVIQIPLGFRPFHKEHHDRFDRFCRIRRAYDQHTNMQTAEPGPILSVFPALIVHSELKSVHPGFPVAFIFQAQVN